MIKHCECVHVKDACCHGNTWHEQIEDSVFDIRIGGEWKMVEKSKIIYFNNFARKSREKCWKWEIIRSNPEIDASNGEFLPEISEFGCDEEQKSFECRHFDQLCVVPL